MCGRYASSRPPEDLAERFAAPLRDEPIPPRWNVAPTDPVYAVVNRRPEGAEEPQRQLRVLRWGLVPSWSKDAKGGAKMINARAETLLAKPAFRSAVARRRCLLPADGYYEWMTRPGQPKQPFFIRRADGEPVALAGIYEFWRDPEGGPDAPWLATCAVVTTAAGESLRLLHDRMPVVLDPAECEAWLDPRVAEEEAVELLGSAAHEALEAVPVSTAVNSVRNDGPELVEPIAPSGP